MAELSTQTLVVFVVSLVLLYGLQLYLGFRKALRSIQNHPGSRIFISPANILSYFLPPIPGIAVGSHSLFDWKHSVFADAGCDVYSVVSAWPKARAALLLADAAVIKEVTSSRARFPKPVHHYKVLSFFGRNIVASEGEEWKRYRKVSAPAFSDRNNKLVWDETCRIMLDMFDNVWHHEDEISVDDCNDLTVPIALFVIGVAGFGRRISWNDDMKIPPGHQMTFKDALHIVSANILWKVTIPDWATGLTKKLRTVHLAFDELERYIMEMIQARRSLEKPIERYDLFSSLLDASGDITDGVKLTDRELLGNIFIFMLAGHETTAHTLCFTFGLLALYQDEQENLYRHIMKILPDGRLPSYEEMPLLTQSTAVLYETLRMFPPVVGIPKICAEDTVLVCSNSAGQKISIPCPKGTDLSIDPPALHYNPRYWDDPFTFKPSRFLGNWPRDAFAPFSVGARACLGRKFFETEGIAILTMLISRYKIEIKEDPQFASETFEERKARILASNPGLTVTPVRVPLTFRRRN